MKTLRHSSGQAPHPYIKKLACSLHEIGGTIRFPAEVLAPLEEAAHRARDPRELYELLVHTTTLAGLLVRESKYSFAAKQLFAAIEPLAERLVQLVPLEKVKPTRPRDATPRDLRSGLLPSTGASASFRPRRREDVG